MLHLLDSMRRTTMVKLPNPGLPDSSKTVSDEPGTVQTGRFAEWTRLHGNAGAVAKAEYQAATRLVRNQRAYGISNAEHAVNVARVEQFKADLIRLGVPLD